MQSINIPAAYNLVSLKKVSSTNEVAKTMAEKGEEAAPDGTLIWALEQTAGRGRRGRNWYSPAGNLFTSLILRPEVPAVRMPELGFVAALAVCDALDSLSEPGHQVQLKWPNDILLNGKKVAGFLLETERTSSEQNIQWIVLGMGLNVSWHPEDTQYPATSLRFEEWPTTVEQALEAYTRTFLGWETRWLNDGFLPIRNNWLIRCKGINEEIEVRLGHENLIGVFTDLDENGALVLKQSNSTRKITTGDVFFPDVLHSELA
ncbi:MAG: biotin--[acetyl-CoA-carboxylase] ligase [Rhodospirillaceae bacterium TMED8]|nr:biotin--[acetyl-CoA-carboxylase] ligase [Magnetovibrio sp.]OUT51685.1 MAG: biotin--[acetyl-CoA-carboxylase] ligase [Rhodospirillaceae bacterium TMED8]|tara:strand:- start:283 stop:1065 length:783 start_codon:yes stop_codon:yes gene_type:complete